MMAIGLAVSGCEGRRVMDQPWCGLVAETGRAECSYPTLEQCQVSMSALGGICTQNSRGLDGGRRRGR
jgi:hypothetical protein